MLLACSVPSVFSMATHLEHSLPEAASSMYLWVLSFASHRAERKKNAPRKAHVPGGQRTLLPFRERLDVSAGRLRAVGHTDVSGHATGGVYRSGRASFRASSSRSGIEEMKTSSNRSNHVAPMLALIPCSG